MRDNRLVSVEDVLDTLDVLMDEYSGQEPGTFGSWAPEIAAAVREIPSARESIRWHDIREELPPVGGLYIVARRRKKGSEWRFDLAQRGKAGWTFGALQGFAVQYWEVLTMPEEVERDDEMAGANRADG
mgnify:CR=1 FL=1